MLQHYITRRDPRLTRKQQIFNQVRFHLILTRFYDFFHFRWKRWNREAFRFLKIEKMEEEEKVAQLDFIIAINAFFFIAHEMQRLNSNRNVKSEEENVNMTRRLSLHSITFGDEFINETILFPAQIKLLSGAFGYNFTMHFKLSI